MAIVNLGRVGYVHKGVYNSETIYEKYDVVFYNHGSYLYIEENPSSGKEPTDTSYWQAMLDPSEMNSVVESAAGAIDDLTSRIDSLTTPFSERGVVVSCHPLANYKLDVCCDAKPIQEVGLIPPSPDFIIPLTPRSSVMIRHTGKNMFHAGDLTVQESAVNIELNPPLKSGVTYVISAIVTSDSEASFEATMSIKEGTSIAMLAFTPGSRISHTLTLNKPVAEITFGMGLDADGNAITVTWTDIQIEVGLETTEYEPYEECKLTTVNFEPAVYGGCIDLKNNIVSDAYRRREIRDYDINFLNDNPNNFDSSYYVIEINKDQPIAIDNDAFMSHYRSHPTLSWNDDNGIYNVFRFYNHNGRTRLAIRPDLTLYPTIESFRAYLEQQKAAGTPVEFVYRTIESETVDITIANKPVFTSTSGVNVVWSDCEETIVNGRLDPAYQNEQQDKRIAALEAAIINAT